jgi:tetratricopeptide (TPR) repeat protein
MNHRPEVLLHWGISEKTLRQYETAAALFTRAFRLGLDTFEVHLELGNVFFAQGELMKARKEYAKCLVIRRNNPVAIFNDGLVLRKMGDLEGAVERYEQALKLDPTFREPALDLAVFYIQSNKTDRALEVLSKVVDADAVVLSLLGAAHLQKNNLDEAQKHLEAALKRNRTLVDARKNLARVYARRGDHARADRYMQSLATLDQ